MLVDPKVSAVCSVLMRISATCILPRVRTASRPGYTRPRAIYRVHVSRLCKFAVFNSAARACVFERHRVSPFIRVDFILSKNIAFSLRKIRIAEKKFSRTSPYKYFWDTLTILRHSPHDCACVSIRERSDTFEPLFNPNRKYQPQHQNSGKYSLLLNFDKTTNTLKAIILFFTPQTSLSPIKLNSKIRSPLTRISID